MKTPIRLRSEFSNTVEDRDGYMVASAGSNQEAHRIVACINACAGIDDENLKALHVASVLAAHAKLLDGLRAALAQFDERDLSGLTIVDSRIWRAFANDVKALLPVEWGLRPDAADGERRYSGVLVPLTHDEANRTFKRADPEQCRHEWATSDPEEGGDGRTYCLTCGEDGDG